MAQPHSSPVTSNYEAFPDPLIWTFPLYSSKFDSSNSPLFMVLLLKSWGLSVLLCLPYEQKLEAQAIGISIVFMFFPYSEHSKCTINVY